MMQLASNLESRVLFVLKTRKKNVYCQKLVAKSAYIPSSSIISYNYVCALLDGEAEELVT